MGGIPGEEDTAGPIVRYLAFVDTKRGEPNRVRRAYSTGKAPVENGLHFLKGRLRRRVGVFENGTDVGDNPVAGFTDGESHKYAVRVPNDVDFGRAWSVFKMNVGEDPIDKRCFAMKFIPS